MKSLSPHQVPGVIFTNHEHTTTGKSYKCRRIHYCFYVPRMEARISYSHMMIKSMLAIGTGFFPFFYASPLETFNTSTDISVMYDRRILSGAFSENSICEKEPIISQHVNHLSNRLQDNSRNSVDMSAWFNYALFDTMGDLITGKSFQCLDKGTLHVRFHAMIVAIFGPYFLTRRSRGPRLSFRLPKESPSWV